MVNTSNTILYIQTVQISPFSYINDRAKRYTIRNEYYIYTGWYKNNQHG